MVSHSIRAKLRLGQMSLLRSSHGLPKMIEKNKGSKVFVSWVVAECHLQPGTSQGLLYISGLIVMGGIHRGTLKASGHPSPCWESAECPESVLGLAPGDELVLR